MGGFTRVLAFLLAAVLCLCTIPHAAFASEYTAVTELASGEYVLVTESGWSPRTLVSEDGQMPWITCIQPQIENGVVSGDNLPLWTLTVTESGVQLQDGNGVSIAPAADGQNGLSSGAYEWSITFDESYFTFHGVSGETPVVLAQNGDGEFRAYARELTESYPEGYPCRFTLYRLTETKPEVPTETTEPTETESTETEPAETEPEPTEPDIPCWGLYFGQLHSHSTLSDGSAAVSQLYDAAKEQGLDFLAVTDHSNSFDYAETPSISTVPVSTAWATGKEAAQAATGNRFVGIYGFEMSWPSGMGLGHISTFNTPGFLSCEQAGFDTYGSGLQNYYNALTSVPGSVSQFSHPGTFYGDFRDFSYYSPAYDGMITLLEVFCGDGLPDALAYYDRALALGWHVAPTAGSTHSTAMGEARTVVYASSLTEAGIYDALKNYRVYATEDSDLSILYYLDGHFMGSRLERRNLGQTMTIRVSLSDPTDVVGTVEVISGGEVIARETVDAYAGTAEFTLPTVRGSYYIRITQPDGQIAVTAPIWIDGEENAGISAFSADTQTPIQGQTTNLTLALYNEEAEELTVEGIALSIGGETIYTAENIGTLAQGETKNYAIPLIYDGLGYTEITATVTAKLGDDRRTYTKTLTLSFRKPEMVTGLLVDGTHGNVPDIAELTALAADNQISVTLETGAITPQMLENVSMLVVPAPQSTFDEAFLTMVTEFSQQGGTVILCGQSDMTSLFAAGELNRLLAGLGSTIAFRADSAQDLENNGGSPAELYLATVNTGSAWMKNVASSQVYRHIDGCTIDPGDGTWLVKGYPTTVGADSEPVVLACEGNIFAAGTYFLSDADLAKPERIWASPFSNRTIVQNLLGNSEPQVILNTISDVRNGKIGEVYHIRGYVTAGTANPYNAFPDTLYLQDDTGGIAVVPFRETGISAGTPIDVVGYLDQDGKNKVFHLISYDVLDASLYRYLPAEAPWNQLLDNSLYGGQLVQVEGSVVSIEYAADGHISGLILEDDRCNYALVHIEDYIRSGATGENILAESIEVGYTVRAMGILFLRGDGISAVRVRNCDEVVYVPPIAYYWKPAKPDNPRVGDDVGIWVAVMCLSGGLLVRKRKKK